MAHSSARSACDASPPPDVWAVQRLHNEARRRQEQHQRNQRLNYCAVVHRIYSYYRETFPAYGKRAWYEMAGRKLSMTADAVRQSVVEAEQWGVAEV